MNNAEKFQEVFGLYATELWAKPENEFLEWLNAEYTQVEKTGFWKDYGSGEWHCSECGFDVLTEGSWEYPETRGYNFCPHCGADMRGE